MANETAATLLMKLVAQPVFREGTRPLGAKAAVAIQVDNDHFTLVKSEEGPCVRLGAPAKPDITFSLPLVSLEKLTQSDLTDIATTGISILKLMLDSDPKLRASAKVHIGLFDLMRLGYLSVLPLGGAPMVRFLAAHGFNGVGKIKEAISKLKDTDGR